MQALPESTSLLYSQILTQCLRGSVPNARGISFVSKNIKESKHWYLQLVVGEKKTQHYLGPDNKELRELIDKEKSQTDEFEDEIKLRQQLVSMAIAGGAQTLSAEVVRIFELLERVGTFLAGGVIVGSHAFALYGNMLGVSWDQASMRTHDVDIASKQRSEILLGIEDKKINLKESLLNSNLGFFEVPALSRKSPSTTFSLRGKELSVDLLTPMLGKPQSEPIRISSLNTYASPVRFLEYLLENVQQAVIIAKNGILVNVPAPAHFALHKLVVSERRSSASQTKATKDIDQAIQLLNWLQQTRPGDITLAYESAKEMPDKFLQQLDKKINELPNSLREAF